MATIEADIPAAPVVPGARAPEPDETAAVEAQRIARDVGDFHRKGLSKRRLRDLTAEKYLIHIDGEGDAQWADILHGDRVAIPPHLTGGPRIQENYLRPMVDNMVAYHTTMPMRFTVQKTLGRDRERSVVDQAVANHVSRVQRWNGLFAEAMYIGAGYGHCPIHVYWRDQVAVSGYDPVYDFSYGTPGAVDTWVGDPWDTVYHAGAKRNSVHAFSYGRTLPAELVRAAFSHVPGIERLEGSDSLPSASRFQRTARKWLISAARDVHGSATIYGGQGGQELVAIICRETLPGVLPDWPKGRLEVIALNGRATSDTSESGGTYGYGAPMLLHLGPLPAGIPSMVRVYSTNRFDDVLGKAYVADLDDLQMLYNQLSTYANEYIRRSVRAPIAVPEGTDLDTMIYEDNAMLEVPAGTTAMPQFASLPRGPIDVLDKQLERIERAMFRIGGWQAASRGEGSSGDSGRKVLALARADDTVHGPVNQRFKEAAEDLAGVVWRLYKEFGDTPSLLDVVGEEAAYLADAFVTSDRLSDRPPNYALVSGFGATTEAKAEQLMQMVAAKGADGEPIMRTRQMRAAWPDDSMFRDEEDPDATRHRRPRVVNAAIRRLAMAVTKQTPQLADLPAGHPQTEALAGQLIAQIDQQFPILMDDDIKAHIDALSLLTQDESEPPLARAIATLRQRMYYQWAQQQVAARQMQQAQMQASMQERNAETGAREGGKAPARTDAASRTQGGRGPRTPMRGSGSSEELAQASAAQPRPQTDARVL